MVFASLEFLTLFFPLFLLAYALSPRAWRNLTLLIFSWIFYAWWSPAFLWVLVSVTIVAWGTGLALGRTQQARMRKALVALSITALAGLLAFYKYANLIVESLIQPLFAAQGHGFVWERLILPIGISFIVLQGISYIVDVYRRTVHVERDFIAFAAYKAMFSQLIAGPIVRYSHVEKELHGRPFDVQHVAAGLRYFMIGLSMKVIIADTLAPLADACFAVPQPTMADAWLGALTYGMQLFFDFAGYSAMAIGIGQMLGFRFPENFNAPYISRSIQEFWRRWHMTLGSWLRDYLYIPLGGSRVAAWRVYLNLMLVMAISGLWHGADSLNFLLWGLLHGLAMVIQRFWEQHGGPKLPALAAWSLTMAFVFSAWILFRAPDLATAWAMYQGQLGMHGYALSAEVASVLRPVHLLTLALAAIAATWPLWRERLDMALPMPLLARDTLALWPVLALFSATALMASRGASPFLYFQF
ncbi:MBOAT family protein [Thiofaba sp. EF100]|uniref:MBOAT family O-acyltransferase n=1 Tax=Thiofaba sp. EF100 TaxID=3121274 RepID=UPI0032217CD4